MSDLLFKELDVVACRACGAVRDARAQSSNDEIELDVCAMCWAAFDRWRSKHGDGITEQDFDRWLARKLLLDLRLLERTGVVGRCQAMSDWLYKDRQGKQCALKAIAKLRDGHLVCGQHLRRSEGPKHTKLRFVEDDGSWEPYDFLGAIVYRLVKRDEKLLRTFSAALGLTKQPWSRAGRRGGKGSSAIDLLGRKFGRLTAVSRSGRSDKGGHAYWVCRCECGEERTIRGDALLNGYYLSCGCWRPEASGHRARTQPRDASGHFSKATQLPHINLG